MNKCPECGDMYGHHRTNCPNREEPATITYCIKCRDSIHEGDRYYDIDGSAWCDYCIGEARRTAERM